MGKDYFEPCFINFFTPSKCTNVYITAVLLRFEIIIIKKFTRKKTNIITIDYKRIKMELRVDIDH